MTEVSVVVSALNSEQTIAALLDGLARQTFKGPWEVVLVDDHSSDATGAVARAHGVAPRVIRTERTTGAGAARNRGVAAARSAVLAFTDADCVPEPDWLAAGLAAMADADLVQGAVEPIGGRIGPYDRTVRVSGPSPLYETANLWVRREWFERAGGFEEIADLDGRPFGEDAWLGWRLRRAGARAGFAADAVVRHAVLPGTPRSVLAEARRNRGFPPLVARIPELRSSLWGRVFLTRRSAAFDLALAGTALALARRAPLPLASTLPWMLGVLARSRGEHGRPVLSRAAVLALADLVTFGALLSGSVRARTPVL